MLSLGPEVYQNLIGQADERGISIQELLRAVIVPHWLMVPTMPAKTLAVGPRPGQVGNRWPKD
jgi:hypothetical protein